VTPPLLADDQQFPVLQQVGVLVDTPSGHRQYVTSPVLPAVMQEGGWFSSRIIAKPQVVACRGSIRVQLRES
ncbi:hypothetical protein, partial [Nocardia sp. NPDC004604]|uniref:hypothetical protein n=1 Tax=Nocardia sp. NPDC004604 TaxID=3157013 RepID=UPI0033A246A1